MECLFEFFIEIIGEAFIECMMYFYMWLMRLIIPDKVLSEKTQKRVRQAVTAYAALLLICLIVGIIVLLVTLETEYKIIGQCMTFIPLGLMAFQFVLGIAFRIYLTAKKKK